jgi:hypothetical protein
MLVCAIPSHYPPEDLLFDLCLPARLVFRARSCQFLSGKIKPTRRTRAPRFSYEQMAAFS